MFLSYNCVCFYLITRSVLPSRHLLKLNTGVCVWGGGGRGGGVGGEAGS